MIQDFRAYTVGYSEIYIEINARNDALQSDKPITESRDDVLPSSQPYAKLYKIHWASRTSIKMTRDDVIGAKTK
jgi:hypothetical protein